MNKRDEAVLELAAQIVDTLAPKEALKVNGWVKSAEKYVSDAIFKKLQEERGNERQERDDAWRAFLQKLVWSKEEIDDATAWVDRTPLRLRSNHELESIIKSK